MVTIRYTSATPLTKLYINPVIDQDNNVLVNKMRVITKTEQLSVKIAVLLHYLKFIWSESTPSSVVECC